jgi:hypothetical protein
MSCEYLGEFSKQFELALIGLSRSRLHERKNIYLSSLWFIKKKTEVKGLVTLSFKTKRGGQNIDPVLLFVRWLYQSLMIKKILIWKPRYLHLQLDYMTLNRKRA